MKSVQCLLISFIFILPLELFSQNLLNQPESIVFDTANNRYLVSNMGNGDIIIINSDGSQSIFNNTVLSAARGLFLSGNILYVAGNTQLVAFDITNGSVIFNLTPPGAQFLNDICADATGNIYISDSFANVIFKYQPANQRFTIFANSNLSLPNGLLFDEVNSRLFVCSFRDNSPIQAVSLADSSVSTVVETTFDNLDGLTKDGNGNIYVSAWGTGAVYRYDPAFNIPPELVSSGHNAPADIFYYQPTNTLAVPNVQGNRVDFVEIIPTAIDDREGNLPRKIELKQNYPNPFNPSTTIEYTLPKSTFVQLKIYNMLGEEVKTLVNSTQTAGVKSVVWNGLDNNQTSVITGVYVYRLTSETFNESRMMLLLK